MDRMLRVACVMMAASSLLQGCEMLYAAATTPGTIHWYKTGATYPQFLDDRQSCVIEARASVSGGAIYNDTTQAQHGQVIPASVFMPCMRAKGWAVDPYGFRPPKDSVSLSPDT